MISLAQPSLEPEVSQVWMTSWLGQCKYWSSGDSQAARPVTCTTAPLTPALRPLQQEEHLRLHPYDCRVCLRPQQQAQGNAEQLRERRAHGAVPLAALRACGQGVCTRVLAGAHLPALRQCSTEGPFASVPPADVPWCEGYVPG
jgi:hypothetical protein